MRRRSSLVCCGLARFSAGSASACVALSRHCCSCCGYTPCSRHQALRADSSMAAVVITASRRAAAVQSRSRAGLASSSLRQRSSVSVLTPISRATTSSAALSGGSNRATALSLKPCPYRANLFSHYRPLVVEIGGKGAVVFGAGNPPPSKRLEFRKDSSSIGATSILPRGESDGATVDLFSCALMPRRSRSVN